MKHLLLLVSLLLLFAATAQAQIPAPMLYETGIPSPTGGVPAPSMGNGNGGYGQQGNPYVNPNPYRDGNGYGQQQPAYGQPQRPLKPTDRATPSDRRRVAIEFQFITDYSYGYDCQYLNLWWLEDYVKRIALEQNLDVVIWGESLARVNNANDAIVGNPRYRQETVPIQGQYEAPAQLFIVKVRAWSEGFRAVVNGYGAGACTAHVEMTLEVCDLQTGKTRQMLVTSEKSHGLQSVLALPQGAAFSLGNVEKTTSGRAARHVVEKVLAKIHESA